MLMNLTDALYQYINVLNKRRAKGTNGEETALFFTKFAGKRQ